MTNAVPGLATKLSADYAVETCMYNTYFERLAVAKLTSQISKTFSSRALDGIVTIADRNGSATPFFSGFPPANFANSLNASVLSAWSSGRTITILRDLVVRPLSSSGVAVKMATYIQLWRKCFVFYEIYSKILTLLILNGFRRSSAHSIEKNFPARMCSWSSKVI